MNESFVVRKDGEVCLSGAGAKFYHNRTIIRHRRYTSADKSLMDKHGRQHVLGSPQTYQPANAKRAARAVKTISESVTAMTPKQVSLHLKTVPNWSKRGQTILRTFKFEGFLEGIDFVNRIAQKAQKSKHHPDIDIRFNKVTLKLTTHDEGGITEKDFSLGRQCDEVFFKYFVS